MKRFRWLLWVVVPVVLVAVGGGVAWWRWHDPVKTPDPEVGSGDDTGSTRQQDEERMRIIGYVQ